MPTPVRILILEDRPADAELMLHELRRAGFDPGWERVEREAEFLARLDPRLDVILADYRLPGFDALRALELLQARGLDVPFIVVTGTLGDEAAVECIKQGAADYVLKDRLARLGHAVARALEDRRLRENRRRAEAALGESEERYRLLVESITDAVVLLDLEGRLVVWNPGTERLTGYGPGELRGGSVFDLLSPEGAREARARLEAIRSGREVPPQVETHVVRKDGSLVPVEAQVARFTKQGRVVGWLAILRDISERRRLQEQLIQSEKLATLGELIAGIAHELNNPLSVLVGHAELLRTTLAGSPHAARAEKLLDAAHRATRVVRNFLTFARKREPERVAVSLNDVVARTLELLAYQCRVANVEVERELAPGLPPIAGDPYQLQQVILNLISNACQAMSARGGGHLRLATAASPDGRAVTLTVADDGPGIPPEHLSRIFEPFFTTKPPAQGTGLGLPIARGIVSEHGGTLTVQSEVGRGTTFVATLPLGPAPPPAPAPPAPPAVPAGLRVLVVDDEEGVRELLAQALESRGCRVEVAGTGREALQVLRRSPADVMVLDVRMPEMSGSQVWQAVRGVDAVLARRTVFCTGDVVSDEAKAFVASTGCPVVNKPFALARLLDAVAEAAAR